MRGPRVSVVITAFIVVLVWLLYGEYQSGSLTAMLTGNLTADQIAQYAANAGFTGDDLVTAVAIALAESSGNPSAYNPETAAGASEGQGSYGLWQIFLKAHPELASWNLYDPQQNANAAYQIYSQSGFSAWTTFKTNAYASYVTAAQVGVQANG